MVRSPEESLSGKHCVLHSYIFHVLLLAETVDTSSTPTPTNQVSISKELFPRVLSFPQQGQPSHLQNNETEATPPGGSVWLTATCAFSPWLSSTSSTPSTHPSGHSQSAANGCPFSQCVSLAFVCVHVFVWLFNEFIDMDTDILI